MKLYYDPISTTTRPVLLFLAEHELPVDLMHVCLLTGEHLQPAFGAVNPNRKVPILVDGEFSLPECSAILKYLAEVCGSATYPQNLRARARVNAAMDWFNTGLSFYFNYLHNYPQFLGTHAWASPVTQAEVLARGLEGARQALDVLDQHMLSEAYVCGPDLTIADYLGAAYVGVGEAVGFELDPWPKVSAWMARMRARPAWAEAHAAFHGMITAARAAASRQLASA
jgi:glutathione S-transferase